MSNLTNSQKWLNTLLNLFVSSKKVIAQPTFTCSKSTIETLKKMWNNFKVNSKNTRTTSFYTPWKHQKTRTFMMFLGGTEWRRSDVFIVNFYFIPFPSISIVDLEQVNVSWEGSHLNYVFRHYEKVE